jgi:hypothetical protein
MNNSGFSGFMGISPNKLTVLLTERIPLICYTPLVTYFQPFYPDHQ